MVLGTNREVFRLGPGRLSHRHRPESRTSSSPSRSRPAASRSGGAAAEALGRARLREPESTTSTRRAGPGSGARRASRRRVSPARGPPQGRRRGRPDGEGHRAARAAGSRPDREPDPPVRPGAAPCSTSLRLRRRLAAHRRTASCWPASTPSPTSSSPRRCDAARSTDSQPAELAALMSCFTYERRGPDAGGPSRRPPGRRSRVAQRARALDQAWRESARTRETHRAARNPPPRSRPRRRDARVGSGESLADVLDEDDELTGGDFVRHVKQVVDLLRQIGDAAPEPETRVRRRMPRPTRASEGSWPRRASCPA